MEVFSIVSGLCESRGVSFAEVERSCGLTNGTISKLRTSMVSSDKMLRIAEYFDVTVEYLLTGKTPEYYTNPKTAEIAQAIFDDPDLHLLFDAAKDATPEELRLLAEMARRMKATNPEG